MQADFRMKELDCTGFSADSKTRLGMGRLRDAACASRRNISRIENRRSNRRAEPITHQARVASPGRRQPGLRRPTHDHPGPV